jgi:hypothetical protein
MGNKIVVLVEGGMVQGICTNADIEVVVWDRDNINAGDDPPDEEWAAACVEETSPPDGFEWVY